VSEAIKVKDFEKAMSLRDPEFHEYLEAFFSTANLETAPFLPENKVRILVVCYSCINSRRQRMRIAIMQ
jgi:6-phosphofructokinase 1